MKLHYFLFAVMLIAGAWITNFKASYYEGQSRVPSSYSPESTMKEMALSAGH